MMGIYVVQEFIQYYMGDVIGAPFVLAGFGKVADTAEAAVSFFIPALLIGAVITTLVAGVLSDKYGRKRMVYLAGALMGIVVLCSSSLIHLHWLCSWALSLAWVMEPTQA